MTTDGVSVVTRMNQRDFYKANIAIWKGRQSLKRNVIVMVICMIGATMLFEYSMSRSDSDPSWLAAAMLGCGVILCVNLVLWPVMIGFACLFSYWAARSLLRSKPDASGPITYEFSSTGGSYSGPNGTGSFNWKAYLKVVETREQFLLYPQKNLAIAVPKRFFQSEDDMQRFRELVRRAFGEQARLAA